MEYISAMNLPAPVISCQNLALGYNNLPALQHVNWQIQAGEHWVITGNRASGKSLLAQALCGRARILSGKITFPWMGEHTDWGLRRRQIALVSFTDHSKRFHPPGTTHYYQQRFQAFDNEGHLTAGDYLRTAGYQPGDPFQQSLLETLGLLPLLQRERIKLSSGQTRRLLLAHALLKKPRVLVLDQPYLGLDLAGKNKLNALLKQLVKTFNLSLIMTGEVADMPDCITHRLHLSGGTAEYCGILGQMPAPPENESVPDVLQQIAAGFRQIPVENGFEQVLRLEDIRVAYGDSVVLDAFNWQIKKGEKWALVGPNGAGKSTLLSLLYGDHPQAYANKVYVFDHRRGRGENIWTVKRRMGFTSPEMHAFYEGKHRAIDLVMTGLFDGMSLLRQPSAEQVRFGKWLFEYFGLTADLVRPVRECSTGTQRLLFFMRALVKAPAVLLLDEPFQGLDARSIFLCRCLLDAVLDQERTLIFITHRDVEIPACIDRYMRL